MQKRYSPWWMPAAIMVLLATTVLLFTLLVLKEAKGIDEGGNRAAVADEDVMHWRMVTTWPKRFPGVGSGPEVFAELVAEMSGGRLMIEVHGANEIVPALGVFGAVSSGSVEIGHGAPYYWKGKIPSTPLYTALPFGMTVLEHNAWIFYGGGLELWREDYEPFNLVPFPGGNTALQMGGWFNKTVDSVDDLKSLKMRIPGLGGEVITRAGASAVNIPGGELYTSLQSGVIDATEWVGPYNDLSFGFHEIAKYYYYPGWQEPSGVLEFIVNKPIYDALPKDLQKIIEVAARAVNQDMLDLYMARNQQAYQELKTKHNVEVRPYPDEVLHRLEEMAWELYEEKAKEDESFARAFRSYKAFMDGATDFSRYSEEAYYIYRAKSRARRDQ